NYSITYPQNSIYITKISIALTTHTYSTSYLAEAQHKEHFQPFYTMKIMKMWKTAAPPMENRSSRPDGKATGFPTARKHRFPQLRKHDRLRTFPQRLLRRISFLSDPIVARIDAHMGHTTGMPPRCAA